jgi:hypothetical protein
MAGSHASRVGRLSTAALVAVGLLNFGWVLAMPGVHNGLTTDEVDYLTKVVPGTPHLYWSAVRAWGTPLLAAPVAIFSPGVGPIRLYFAIVLTIGLVLAYLPWRRVLHPAVAPLAAVLFASTWFTTFFGNIVMPNLPIALGCVAATGVWAGLPRSSRPHRSLLGLALLVGAVALIRPSDSLLLALPLGALTVLDRARNRKLGLAALLAGEAIGWIPWVIESYLSFGGPVARWHEANTELHGVHLRFALVDVYPRLFDGSPGYCCFGRPAATAGPVSATATAWFIGILVLSAAGLIAGWRLRRLSALGACGAVAAAFVVMYVGLLNYGSMRFLLPVIGLLAIPIATGLVWAVVTVPKRATAVVALGCVAVVAAHLALQISQDLSFRPKSLANRRIDLRIAAQTKRYVQHRPCLFVSPAPEVIAYYLKCHIAEPGVSFTTASVAEALGSGWSVVAVPMSTGLHAEFAFIKQAGWVRRRLHVTGVPWPRFAYVPPDEVAPRTPATGTPGG